MPSKSENIVAQNIRRLIAELPVDASKDWPDQNSWIGDGLDPFLPELLGEIHPYWIGESFDGFRSTELRKLGPQSAELLGEAKVIGAIEKSESRIPTPCRQLKTSSPGSNAKSAKK